MTRGVPISKLSYRWRISRQAIHQQIERGKIRGVTIGNTVYVPVAEVRRLERDMMRKLETKAAEIAEIMESLQAPLEEE